MHDLPAHWSALCGLVFMLGVRHGLDADHLAAIDGLTRVGARHHRAHARYCGALFSLGHGLVVIAIAALTGLLGERWAPPAWFEPLGSAISIGFLALLGAVNLHSLLRAPRGVAVPLTSVRGPLLAGLLARLPSAPTPVAALGVGAVFALSFDTLTQAALFAALGVQHGGATQALVLGLLFTLGMSISDGLNGLWISWLIDRADRRAALVSRWMTATVACISLAIAALGIARMASATLAARLDDQALPIGLGVVVVIALCYALAARAARRPSRVPT